MRAYRTMMARVGGVLLLAGLFVVASTQNAEAVLTAYICNDAACAGGDDIVVVDDAAGDLNAVDGAILITNGLGSVEIALSYPAVGSPADPFLNLTYNFIDVLIPTVYLYAAQDPFTFQSPPNLIFEANSTAGSGFAGAFGGAGSFSPPPVVADLLSGGGGGLGGPLGAGAYSSGGSVFLDSFASPTAPYYLAVGLAISPNASNVASGDATILVPEPATIALFGLGLLGVGAASRRRRKAQAQVQ